MKRIVIVDDVADIRFVISRFLESKGYVVNDFDSVQSAYSFLRSESADLILLDINLPEEDGFAGLKIFKGALPNVPICFLSGTRNKMIIDKCLSSGGDDYILKPVVYEELVKKVKNLVMS